MLTLMIAFLFVGKLLIDEKILICTDFDNERTPIKMSLGLIILYVSFLFPFILFRFHFLLEHANCLVCSNY